MRRRAQITPQAVELERARIRELVRKNLREEKRLARARVALMERLAALGGDPWFYLRGER